ncbi:hypothetical protein O3M35_011660 [Rhynocoris fuscipes]|uniref:Peptidase S1 domain-containing protein n=1 Tax=Rhynocoris fuscipes TaxID=488301 RepID=A0AAW1CZB7_9HEMI
MANYYKNIAILLVFYQIKTTCTRELCINSEYIKPGQIYSINNPLFPRKYRAGTVCNWFFSTAADYEVRLNCRMVDLPKLRNVPKIIPNCWDKLTVIGSGNYSQYCQPFNMSAPTITMVLSSVKWGLGGVFSCNVTPQKIRTLPFQPIENCQCGWRFATKSRIVGGTDAEMNEFPSLAIVIHRSKEDEKGKLWCSATIITPRAALSAAHCYNEDRNINNYILIVGEHDTSLTNETDVEKHMKLSRIIINKAYESSTYRNDIALLITEQEIKYSPKVGPACLPFNIDKNDVMGKYLTAAGWGSLTLEGKRPKILQKVRLQVVEDSHCTDTYNEYYYMYNSSQQICTYSPGKDACTGDSGGPLYYTDQETNSSIIVGIISYGNGCGTAPGVNVLVNSFLPWIMENLSPDLQTCGK